MDDWTDLSNETKACQLVGQSPLQYLTSQGKLSEKQARRIIEVAGIDTMSDLILLRDHEVMAQVRKDAKLMIIPARKLMRAIRTLDQAVPGSETEASMRTSERARNAKIDECVVIAIDRSCSMGSGLAEPKAFGPNAEKTLVQRSRMDAVKQCFYAFRDRIESLGSDTHHMLGLLQFDDRVEELLPLTSNLDKFESLVDKMKQRGMTAIYSAICQACDMLKPFGETDDTTDLRVLVLTDGQSNNGVSAQEALDKVRKVGVVVDAMLVGNRPDTNLCKIVSASGGMCFQINSLSDGFELMEAESVVSLRSRRGGAGKPKFEYPDNFVELDDIQVNTIVAANEAAKVATVPAAELQVNSAVSIVRCPSVPGNTKVQGSMSRIMKEVAENSRNPIAGIHVYVNENNVRISIRCDIYLVAHHNVDTNRYSFLL